MRSAATSNIADDQVVISNLLQLQEQQEIILEIFRGLTSGRKYIDSRFFYDERGSGLFERITTLEEYYPTRTETAILKAAAHLLVDSGEDLDIIELGSGDCSKISILLDAIPPHMIESACYYPVDISESAVFKSAGFLAEAYPGLQIEGILVNFMEHLDTLPGNGPRLVCFFGSTIGNLNRPQAEIFMAGLKKLMDPGDSLLLGLDMVKEVEILEAAYNDSQGVTEEFNKNILRSINHLAGTNFNPDHFDHDAFYDQEERRIEMHLVANRELEISGPYFPRKISIRKGEGIHTENSHKFSQEDIDLLVDRTGFTLKRVYTDHRGWFSLVHFTA